MNILGIVSLAGYVANATHLLNFDYSSEDQEENREMNNKDDDATDSIDDAGSVVSSNF